MPPQFGLSPISADRVDLDRFPEFASAATHRAVIHAGDALYIPDGWWHLVKSHPGRNVAVAVEFEPFERGVEQHWPRDVLQRYRWGGTFWAEQVRIKYAMRERLAARRYAAGSTGRPIKCAALRPPVLFSELGPQMDSSH